MDLNIDNPNQVSIYFYNLSQHCYAVDLMPAMVLLFLLNAKMIQLKKQVNSKYYYVKNISNKSNESNFKNLFELLKTDQH